MPVESVINEAPKPLVIAPPQDKLSYWSKQVASPGGTSHSPRTMAPREGIRIRRWLRKRASCKTLATQKASETKKASVRRRSALCEAIEQRQTSWDKALAAPVSKEPLALQ